MPRQLDGEVITDASALEEEPLLEMEDLPSLALEAFVVAVALEVSGEAIIIGKTSLMHGGVAEPPPLAKIFDFLPYFLAMTAL